MFHCYLKVCGSLKGCRHPYWIALKNLDNKLSHLYITLLSFLVISFIAALSSGLLFLRHIKIRTSETESFAKQLVWSAHASNGLVCSPSSKYLKIVKRRNNSLHSSAVFQELYICKDITYYWLCYFAIRRGRFFNIRETKARNWNNRWVGCFGITSTDRQVILFNRA